MTNGSSLAAGLIICLGLSVYAFSNPTTSPPFAPPTQAQAQVGSGVSYAILSIEGETFIFDTGGAEVPRKETMVSLMRSLGSREKATFVNVLNAIGNGGWEMVQKDDTADGAEWLFKRS